jgi:hypothetical protein
MPGRINYVSVTVNGERQHTQKQLILCNLKEAFQTFKDINPDLKICFSTFAELRPTECIFAGEVVHMQYASALFIKMLSSCSRVQSCKRSPKGTLESITILLQLLDAILHESSVILTSVTNVQIARQYVRFSNDVLMHNW